VTADLVTERWIEHESDLDLRSTRELVELINDADATVAAAVRVAAGPLAAAIDAVAGRLARGGRLVYVGAGTSGRLAVVDAAECGPTFGLPDGTVLAIVAGGPEGFAGAREAAEDDADAGARDIAAVEVGPADALVALSASGRTPYVLGALRAAANAGALTVAVVCAPDTELAAAADRAVVAVVGPEVLAGSTRMKAGTAQKLILNTISTVSMIRLGRTFGNLMVGVAADNEKLRARARRTVSLATGAADAEVDAALEASGGDPKIAIVSLLAGVDAPTARARLEEARGVVRRALAPR
jgi:N-acetylmuramic acid 6-phosphate etherase